MIKELSIFFIFSFIIFSFNAFSDSTVRIDDLDDFSIYASSSTSPEISMVVSAPGSGGIGSTEDDPVLVWIPIDSGGGQTNSTAISTPSLLPENPTVGNSAYIKFSLSISNSSSSDQYINVAVEDDGEYESFKMVTIDESRLVSASSEAELTVIISLSDLCDQFSSSEYCSEDIDFQEDILIHFYLDENVESNSDVETSTNGLFFKLQLSDQVPTESMTLTAINRGDEKLLAELTISDSISYMGDDFYEILIYQYSDSTLHSSSTIGASGATYFGSYEADENDETGDFFSGGTISIGNLTNDTEYNLALTKVNNYQFAAPLSNSLMQTPENIASFMESQSCYLLSAGFQKHHYVLDYFRNIRDQYLMTSSLGRSFVNWYYEVAPQYTSYIIESEILSAIIRFLGYLFYFLFMIGPFVFVALLILGTRSAMKNLKPEVKGLKNKS